MYVHDLFQHIERTAPLQYASAWDRAGVQVAARTDFIHRLAVALDATPEIVSQAVAQGCQMLLAHHPLTLTPQLPNQIDAFWQVLHTALGAGLWIYAAHTSLDTNLHGPAAWLARALGLRSLDVLEEHPSGAAGVGFGQIGDLPHPVAWPQLRERLEQHGVPCHRQVGSAPACIRRVAICPGSGASLGRTAFANGAHVYITGDIKYHEAQSLSSLGLTVDAGHFVLEEAMMRTWSDALTEELAPQGVAVHFFPGHDPFVSRL